MPAGRSCKEYCVRPQLAGVLSALEDRETPLLNWGLVDGTLSEAEVHSVIGAVLDLDVYDDTDLLEIEDTVEDLLDYALLIKVPDRAGYRTRLAETVRLAVLNRQLFGRGSGAWWSEGARLVSDFRLDVRPRSYPRRDLSLQNLRDALAEAGLPVTASQDPVLLALTQRAKALSRFQVDSTRAILTSLARERSTAVIVSAGTGSGKTLAFYLPAMAWLSGRIAAGEDRTHVLALYPRKELLKDQLAEALRAANESSDAIRARGGRDLRLGAFYGDTPRSAEHLRYKQFERSWPVKGDGRVCPYLTCPVDGCGSEVVWPKSSIAAGVEELRCVKCSWRVGADRLALTRKSMEARPPDILFPTTEMLSRNSANRRTGRLFGWDPTANWRPRLLLLDEVHTYEGVHGAQVALLLRRWRHAIGRPVTVVGLSATLGRAPEFLSDLTGIGLTEVQHVEPKPEDQVLEGRQYQLVLRGDPLSGASLLSTSIQTIMLLARTLDPAGQGSGLFGSKAFVFTDNLDVVNRLFHDLRDAEGRGWMSKRRQANDKVLANLRSPHQQDRVKRAQDGQSWDLVEAVGHRLPGSAPARPMDVGRTNSQDPGVADKADVIVATASLDVGYNDPRVGLVMQHKAPRNGAQFLQRRGRAGRVRQMRPLTVVTLTDYGRDRLAYQAYETLFDPEVVPRSLPVGNRYVLRMQATFALTDWLMRLLPDLGDLRTALQPERADDPGLPRLVERLETLLVDAESQRSFSDFLQRALRIDEGEAQAILWEPPRALLSTVVPTLLRRVRTRWQSLEVDPGNKQYTFAPDFVPKALFEPLALPEVELLLPGERDDVDSTMGIAQALREVAPGRVSKRFAVEYGGQRTWVPPHNGDGGPVLTLADFVRSGEVLGRWPSGSQEFVVVRPHQVAVTQPPAQVKDTSQSTPIWATEVVVQAPGRQLDVPQRTPWAELVTDVVGYMHAQRSAVEVRRYMTGAEADLRDRDGDSRSNITFVDRNGTKAALGFALDVDAMQIRLALPSDDMLRDHPRFRSAGWRGLAFEHALMNAPSLNALANVFQLQWLHQAVLAAVVDAALERETDLATVLAELTPTALGDLVRPWILDLADSPSVRPDQSADGDGSDDEPGRHVARLLDLMARPEFQSALLEVVTRLTSTDMTPDDFALARNVMAETSAAAIHAAVLRLERDVDEEDLAVDVRVEGAAAEVWITETTIGGAGVLERLLRRYQADPRRFWRLVLHSLAAADLEVVDGELTRLIDEVVREPNGVLAAALDKARTANDNETLAASFDALLGALRERGSRVTHAVTSSLAARPLRPGWTRATDAQVHRLYAARRQIEERFAIELDERTWTRIAVKRRRLSGLDDGVTAGQAYALLWPSSSGAYNRHLTLPALYGKRSPVDRSLLADLLPQRRRTVAIADVEEWRVAATEALQQEGAVDLAAGRDERGALRDGLLDYLSSPLEVGYLLLHPVVRAVSRHGAEIRVTLELQEAEQ